MGENEQKPVEPAGEINEPVIESAPTAPADPTDPIAAAPAPAPVTAPKKNKTGIIIAGVVVALGLGGFGVAYAMDTKPENVAASAISDFLSAKAMSVDGTFEVSKDDDMSVKLELKTNNTESRNTSTDASLTVNYGGEEIKLSLGTVVLKDYTIYVKLDGLKEAAKQAIKAADSTSYGDYAELYEDLIDTVVGEIDGVWWKISVPELIDDIDEISTSQKKSAKEAWQCVVEAADKASEKQGKYADIYKENAFVSLKDYKGDKKSSAKGTAYTLELDAAKLTKFANEMSKEADDLGINDCLSKIKTDTSYSYDYDDDDEEENTTTTTVKEVKEEDVKKAIEDLPEIVLTIENGIFSHKLTGLYIDLSNDEYTGKVDLVFNRDVKEVSAPSDAKSVTTLVETVTKAYEEWEETSKCKVIKTQYPSYYSQICDPTTNKVKPEYQSMF